jgi:chemotaxis signal transduction protein
MHPFDLLLQLDQQLQAAKSQQAGGSQQRWHGFAYRLRDSFFLSPQEDVREVLPVPTVTRIPGAKPWVMGVANVRGSIYTIVDLAAFLELPPSPESRSRRVMLFADEKQAVGFLVDDVMGYRSFGSTDQSPKNKSDLPALAPHLLGAFHRYHDDHNSDTSSAWQVLSLHRLVVSPSFAQAGW